MCFLFLTLLNYTLSAGFYHSMGMTERFVSASNAVSEAALTRQALSTILGWIMIKVLVCGITTGNFVFLLCRKKTYLYLSLGKLILSTAVISLFVEVVSLNMMIPIPFHLLCFVLLCVTEFDEVSLLHAASRETSRGAHQNSSHQKKAA